VAQSPAARRSGSCSASSSAQAPQFYLGRVIPIERWTMWGTGIGSFVGFVAVAFEQ
jgi:hypothetical protein